MNYLKVASIANLEVGKREIEKRFLADQSQANHLIKQNHMTNYNYNEAQELVGVSSVLIPDGRKVKFGEGGDNGKMQGRILEEQLKMKGLESEYDLEKSRIEDANNAKTFRIRYPYGKENVRITEDVLEKYKGSQDQSNVLKRFQQQAKQLRHFKNSQKRLQYQAPFYRPVYNNTSQMVSCNRGRRITSILEVQKKKLQQAKQEYMRSGMFWVNVVQKSKQREKEEARRMGKLEEMLKDVREKMDVNFSMILENQNQTERNRKFVRQVDLTRGRLQKIRAVDRLQATERNRLPVVVYKENKYKQENFINRSLCLDLIDYERPTHIQKPEQYKKVLKIYNANKQRLDKLCQRISVKSQDANGVIY